MKLICQHCTTPFHDGSGDGAFCCSGCRQVYELIRAEGLDDYYALQDRMGRPVGEAVGRAEDVAKWTGLQKDAEKVGAELELPVDGMSCLGCVWLVERICRAEPGVLSARVSLQENRLSLKWDPGAFDLSVLVGRLRCFGYRLVLNSSPLVGRWSPLTWRLVLCGIFAANGVLLAMPEWVGADVSAYGNLFLMLSLAFTALSLFVGASHFLVPVLRSLRVGMVHHDSLWCVGLLALMVQGAIEGYEGVSRSVLWRLPLLVFLSLAVRWLHLRVWSAVSGQLDSVTSESVKLVQRWIGGLSVGVVLAVAVLGWLFASNLWPICFAAALYPVALAGRYESNGGILTMRISLCVAGVACVAWLGLSYFAALACSFLVGLLVITHFATWKVGEKDS